MVMVIDSDINRLCEKVVDYYDTRTIGKLVELEIVRFFMSLNCVVEKCPKSV